MRYSLLPLVALLSSQVAAHGVVKSITANGKEYAGYNSDSRYQDKPTPSVGWTADNEDQGPIMGDAVNTPDIICHKNASPGTLHAEVAAGSKIKIQWTPWPESHKGPVMDFLAPCDGDCSKVDKTKLKFFTVDKVGMTSTVGNPPRFADDDMISAGNTWEVTIPAHIKAGNYVLRHETIALHEGQTVGKAQLYPQCFNLKVTGNGDEVPAGVLGTQIYTPSEKGVVFDIYKKYSSVNDYPVPGPDVWSDPEGDSPAPAAAPKSAPIADASAPKPSSAPAPKPVPAPAPAPVASAPASPPKGGSYAEGSQAPPKPAPQASPSYGQEPQKKKNACHRKRSHPRDLSL